jgi:hypothetical protein
MRKGRAVMVFMVVAQVVLLSALAERRPARRAVTGMVAAFDTGQWLTVARDATDPRGITFALHRTTAYHPPFDPAVLRRAVRVIVGYRMVGERRPLADRVQVVTAFEP